MNLLDRHIFKSVLGTCAAAVGLFAFVLILGNVINDLLGHVLAGRLDWLLFGWLVVLLLPWIICYALPLGMITGVLLTLGRMSADSEITAMRAAGISLFRIARPVLLLGVLGVGVALYANLQAMPWARVQYHRELDEAVRANALRWLVPKTFIREFSGVVVYIGEKNGPILRDLWIWKLDREKRVVEFGRAESGRIDYDEEANEFVIVGVNARAEKRYADNPEDLSRAPYVGAIGRTEPWRISLEQLFGPRRERRRVDWMTLAQSEQELARLAAARDRAPDAREHARAEMRVRIAVQDKFSTAFAVLAFAVIGVPLGVKVSRRETSANLGVAVLLALGHYLLTVAVKALDRHPEYRPDLLLMLPNVVFLVLAVWLFRRIEK